MHGTGTPDRHVRANAGSERGTRHGIAERLPVRRTRSTLLRSCVSDPQDPASVVIYDTCDRKEQPQEYFGPMGKHTMPMRQCLDAIFRAGVAAVEPRRAVCDSLRLDGGTLRVEAHAGVEHNYALDRYAHVHVVGCGKAGAAMAQGAVDVLGERIGQGVISTKYGHTGGFADSRIRVIEAGHPHPDASGLDAARQALALLERSGSDGLVVALISGGGSALWPLPAEGITLKEKLATTDLLLGCGADIVQVNCVRKHLSAIKGGQAAKAASPSDVIVLVVSDVVGDPLDAIASGPFHPDPTTFGQALSVVREHGVEQRLPRSVRERLEHGVAGGIAETPKEGQECFRGVVHTICAGNTHALGAAAAKARELGMEARVLTAELQGDVSAAADYLMREVRQSVAKGVRRPVCLLSGGETTVRLGPDHGRGGRNQQLALEMALRLEGIGRVAALCCGTDGTDGPTDAAGGVVDGSTVRMAAEHGLDVQRALRSNDAYPLLDTLGMLVRTGPTGTNVMDIQVVVIHPAH
ncbi:MAG: DUF4147 domain-containing protein [Chitinivibrionales bacterium]|nr:DUF4147 domain-containing protein [Chitinivibrionales bacterium]